MRWRLRLESQSAFSPDREAFSRRREPTREPMQYMPQFSLPSATGAGTGVRKKMLMEGLDALVLLGNDIYWGMGMANLRYLVQVDAHLGAQAIFPLTGDPVVWHGVVHMNRPTSMYHSVQEWVTDIRTGGGLPPIVDELEKRGLARGRLGLVGVQFDDPGDADFSSRRGEGTGKALPNATLVDASAILQEMRMVKSPEEIEMLRRAGKVARKVVDAMIATARPGVTDAAVYAEMIRTQIANGGEPNIFNLFSSGPVEHPPQEIWHLLHGCDQPLTPSMRPLQPGDLVIAEWHTKFGGYRCHTEYTVYLGKRAPKELLHIWDVSVECLEASKRALTAGRTIREAVAMIRKPAERAGLDFVELGFHAMGTASPEFPTVIYYEGFGSDRLNGSAIGDMVLEEGMCFGNNVDLHD